MSESIHPATECESVPQGPLIRVDESVDGSASESAFLAAYLRYRNHFVDVLHQCNPGLSHSSQELEASAQKVLARLLFVLFCEDMSVRTGFPSSLLKDTLRRARDTDIYDSEKMTAWARVRSLFKTMSDGGDFDGHPIAPLGAHIRLDLAEFGKLRIPNHLLCGDGGMGKLSSESPAFIELAQGFRFGMDSMEREGLPIEVLGRVLEQSMTRGTLLPTASDTSPQTPSRRKRDGVFFTPTWLVQYIVEQTIGQRLAELRRELGCDPSTRHKGESYLNGLKAYRNELKAIQILDPSCGCGAFLVGAYQYLFREHEQLGMEILALDTSSPPFSSEKNARIILEDSLYGVDLDPEAIELTRLSLWLHAVRPNISVQPCALNLRCGNAIIGPGYNQLVQSKTAQQRANPLDWATAFPRVFDAHDPGFDCIVGNPPYVKLQTFRAAFPDQVDYLTTEEDGDGRPTYHSTQTGHFDLYLPFIERGVALLNRAGKLGYIAPSGWIMNAHGRGLRSFVSETRSLDRWLDFKFHQVFSDAKTYTAAQFFVKTPVDTIRYATAVGGRDDALDVDWQSPLGVISYSQLTADKPWVFVSQKDATLWEKIHDNCVPLASGSYHIGVGVQTSADAIFQLKKLAPGRYLSRAGGRGHEVEVTLEDELLRPLVSGREVHRYEEPSTQTYVIFPYRLDLERRAHLIEREMMMSDYPFVWTYMCQHEVQLRGRERGKMDRDDRWWGYNYPKNINRQDQPKLCIAQTVPHLRVAYDVTGQFCLNNVRVNGVFCDHEPDRWFLLALLNAPVADYVFRRIAKPKVGGYFEANKQFIAPLPIPVVDEEKRLELGAQARDAQALYTQRRRLMERMDRSLNGPLFRHARRDPSWLWPQIQSVEELKHLAPTALRGAQLSDWARKERRRRLKVECEMLEMHLKPGASFTVECVGRQISFCADGRSLVSIVADEDAHLIATQWRQWARRLSGAVRLSAQRLMRSLLTVHHSELGRSALELINLDGAIQTLDAQIVELERRLNQTTYSMYGLSKTDIALLEEGLV